VGEYRTSPEERATSGGYLAQGTWGAGHRCDYKDRQEVGLREAAIPGSDGHLGRGLSGASEEASMLAVKFFHEALEAHENTDTSPFEQGYVEAVRHRMLTSRIMLAELTPGYGCRLVVQTGSDSDPRFKVYDDIGNHDF
jgi:hypothetical protein